MQVRPEWIDENGHLNLAYYVVLFDWATDHLWDAIGLGDSFRASGHGTFAVETHTLYKAELLADAWVASESLILAVDAKRLHIAHELRHTSDGGIAAQQELMFLAVNLVTRRSELWPPPVATRLRAAAEAHSALARPAWVGRRVAMPSPA